MAPLTVSLFTTGEGERQQPLLGMVLLWRSEQSECRGAGMPLHLVTENKHTAIMLRRLNVLLEFLHVQHLVLQEDRPSGTGVHKVLDR